MKLNIIVMIITITTVLNFFNSIASAQEENELNKAKLKNAFKFVDEQGVTLFDDKVFYLKDGAFEISNGIAIQFLNVGGKKWIISILSDDYFLDEKKNSVFKNGDCFIEEDSIKEVNSLILSQYCKIQIIIQYGEGMSVLPDDTICELYDSCCHIASGKIKNGSAVFTLKEGGVHTIAKITAGSYFKNFSRNISLVRGETSSLELDVELGKMQSFRIVDSRQQPLEGYYLYISRRNQNAFNIREIRNKMAQTGILQLSKVVAISGKDGIATIEDIANDDYSCYIFNKNISEQMYQVKIGDARKPIELIVKDEDRKTLTLKVTFNDQPYLEELKITYFDLSEFSAMYNKAEGKFNNGVFEIKSLKPSKYQFQLNTNKFQREVVEFDFKEKNNIEYTFSLRSSDIFVHGFIKDKNNKPMQNILVELSEKKSKYSVKTNEEGYFKIGGLENDHSYGIWISTDRPTPANLPEKIRPSREEFNITLDDQIYFSGTVLDIEGMPVENFSIAFTCYEDKNCKRSSLSTGGTFKNGKFVIEAKNYGYFKVEAKIPNMPIIRKVFPVLKAEDNLPVTLQAEAGFTITGTVIDFEGRYLEGVSVTRFSLNSSSSTIVNGEILKTDKDGYFKLDNCQLEEEYFFVKKGYYPISTVIKAEDKNIPLKLAFPKTYKLSGTLLTSEKKPHALVFVGGSSKTNKNYKFEGAETGPDGAFTINAILPGEWYVYFDISLPKGVKKPGKIVKIVDKDEELHLVFDIPKD